MTKLIKKLSDPKLLLFFGLIYTLAVTIIFVMPVKELPKSEFPIDKLAHVLLMLCLSFIWLIFFFVRNGFSLNVKTVCIVLVVCFIYGIVIEIIQQRFVEYRHADIWDVVANTMGFIWGYIVFHRTKHILKP